MVVAAGATRRQISVEIRVPFSSTVALVQRAARLLGNIHLVDWILLSQVCAGGLLGMLAGRLIAEKIAGTHLQRLFALGLVVIALLTLTHKLGNGVT